MVVSYFFKHTTQQYNLKEIFEDASGSYGALYLIILSCFQFRISLHKFLKDHKCDNPLERLHMQHFAWADQREILCNN